MGCMFEVGKICISEIYGLGVVGIVSIGFKFSFVETDGRESLLTLLAFSLDVSLKSVLIS